MSDEFSIVKDFRDSDGDGYVIEQVGEKYRWAWHERDITDRERHTYPTIAEALREAADDWEMNGESNSRRAAILKAAATREEKKAATS